MQRIIELARKMREKKKVSLKQPITSVSLITSSKELYDSLKPLLKYLEEEINTPSFLYEPNTEKYIYQSYTPNNKALGQRLKKQFNDTIRKRIMALTPEEIKSLQTNGKLTIEGVDVLLEEV